MEELRYNVEDYDKDAPPYLAIATFLLEQGSEPYSIDYDPENEILSIAYEDEEIERFLENIDGFSLLE